MDETFSSIDLITQCLTDEKRTLKFQEAIEKAVRPGMTVLDAGTGSSILALFAARAGAAKVIAVEFDPYVAKLARENVINNGFENVIQIIVGDARHLNLPEGVKFDLVLMEMLTTGMVDEYQVWAINNLHEKGLVNEKTVFLPKRQETSLALTATDFTAYGLNMRMVKHLWEPFPVGEFTLLTDTKLLSSVSFDRMNDIRFSAEIDYEATKDGVLNSIYLTSVTVLDDELSLGDTLSLNAPVVIPLASDSEVKKGQALRARISYEYGNGFRNLTADISGI